MNLNHRVRELSALRALPPRGSSLRLPPAVLRVARQMEQSTETRISRLKVYDEPDLQGVAVFARAYELSRSVGLIRTRKGTGTCVLVGANRIVTNNHVLSGSLDVLATPADANDATVTFNYELDARGRVSRSKRYRCSTRLGFKASVELDYALVGVVERPGDRWGLVAFPLKRPALKAGDDVFIIQHPEGRYKQAALTNNEVREVQDTVIRYVTDTMEGSSGSPVFDGAFRFVALHHAERRFPATKRRKAYSLNQAIWAHLIRADIEGAS